MNEDAKNSMETLAPPLATVTGWPLDPSPSADLIHFTVSHEDGVYAVGEMARLVVSLDGRASATLLPAVARITLVRDFQVPLEEREWNPGAGPLTLDMTLNEPGQIMATVTLTRAGEARPLHQQSVGVLFGPKALVPSWREPEDFDAFWAGELGAWKRRVATPVLTAVATGTAAAEVWDVQIPIERERPVVGYLGRPRGARPGTCPAVMLLHSASGYNSADLGLTAEFAARGFLALNVTPHGLPNAQPDAFYSGAQQAAGNFRTEGLGSRETWYFKAMFLRVAVALDYLAGRPEWNGTVLDVFGSSMGGAQALAGAALDTRVTGLVLNVPAMCDLLPAPPRAGAWPRPLNEVLPGPGGREAIAKTVAYYDMVFFARRIKAPVLLTIGLIDATCPACGLMTMVNQLPGPVTARVYPGLNHGWVPAGRAQLYDVLERHSRSGLLQ